MVGCPAPFGSCLPLVLSNGGLVAPTGTYNPLALAPVVTLTFPQAMDESSDIALDEAIYRDANVPLGVFCTNEYWLDSLTYILEFVTAPPSTPPCTFEYAKALSHLRTAAGQEYDAFGPIALAAL